VLPLISGIIISYFVKKEILVLNSSVYTIILLFLAILIIVLYDFLFKNKLNFILYYLFIILFGFISFQFRHFNELESGVSQKIKDGLYDKIILKGIVSENPEIKQESIRMLLDDLEVDGAKAEGLVLASVYRNKFKETEPGEIGYGSIVEIEGSLENLPEPHNPGEFNYGEYLKLHGVNAVFYTYGFDKIKITGTTEPDFYKNRIINPVKKYSVDIINKYVGGDEGEYLKGLVLGERSNISKEIKEDFVNAGVAHIIAVSGLNVAYVIVIIWALLIFIPINQKYKIFLTIIILVFYMNLTGNTPSIIRATIMASVFLLAQVFERKIISFNIISFAALIILVIDPRQLFDAGFILSFSAILSIVILYPKIDQWLRNMNWYSNLNTEKPVGKSVKFILALFFGTLAAQIGILPVTALMFKKISVVSLIVNLFAIPLSNIALAAGFIIILVSVFSSWLASVFASFNIMLLYIQLKAIAYFAAFEYAFFEAFFVNFPFLIIYYLLLILIFTISKKNYTARIIIAVLILLNFAVISSIVTKTNKVQLTYLDVGNSNSTLIKMPEGTNILINSGSSTDKYFSAERNIMPYLKKQGCGVIDVLFINSLNLREYKNLMFLIKNYPVKKAVIPVYYKPLFDDMKIAGKVNTDFEFITESKIFNRQGNFRIYVYYNPDLKGESMMSELVFGEQSFIFNDAKDILEDYINTSYLPDDNALMVLKASGSGSFDYNSAGFIAKAEPEFVIVSSSQKGRKKKDSGVFEQSLNETGYTVLKTGNEGAIIFETDGYETKRVMWR